MQRQEEEYVPSIPTPFERKGLVWEWDAIMEFKTRTTVKLVLLNSTHLPVPWLSPVRRFEGLGHIPACIFTAISEADFDAAPLPKQLIQASLHDTAVEQISDGSS